MEKRLRLRRAAVWLALYPTVFLICSARLNEAEKAILATEATSSLSSLITLDARGCPLKLSVLNYDPRCFEDGELGQATAAFYSGRLPLCCVQIIAGLAKLMATYTNTTGMLLLAESQGQACLHEMVHDLTSAKCAQVVTTLLLSRTPCSSFATLAQLTAQLHSIAASNGSNLSFDRLLQGCGRPSSQQPLVQCPTCAASFEAAVSLLSSALHDDSDICAATLFVSLASTTTDDPVWTNSLYDCASKELHIFEPKTGSHKLPWIVISVAIIVGALVTLIAAIVYQRSTQKRKISFYGDMNPVSIHKGSIDQGFSNDESTNFVYSVGLYTFSLEEIINATGYFNDDNLLGEGVAGKVFKGVLPSGQFVAVKRIDRDNKPSTFKTELVNLSKVRHAHLVTLMGFCQSNDAYYLVYEYCSNGDLSKWLFVNDYDTGNILSWEQRVRIAANTARGLWFLHNYPGGSIIHRDIKPTNILLNEHLEAKLSDFGLARHMETENSHIMTEVKGTTGYLDPEYLIMGELTQASDVYSFGVVLLQLISGRRAIELDPIRRVPLLKNARLIAETGEGLEEFVDPRLQGCYSFQSMIKIFEVGILCIASSRQDRLTMKEVLQNLEHASQLSFSAPLQVTLVHDYLEDHEDSQELTPQSLRIMSHTGSL